MPAATRFGLARKVESTGRRLEVPREHARKVSSLDALGAPFGFDRRISSWSHTCDEIAVVLLLDIPALRIIDEWHQNSEIPKEMPINDVPTAATLKQSNRASVTTKILGNCFSGSVIFPPVRAR